MVTIDMNGDHIYQEQENFAIMQNYDFTEYCKADVEDIQFGQEIEVDSNSAVFEDWVSILFDHTSSVEELNKLYAQSTTLVPGSIYLHILFESFFNQILKVSVNKLQQLNQRQENIAVLLSFSTLMDENHVQFINKSFNSALNLLVRNDSFKQLNDLNLFFV